MGEWSSHKLSARALRAPHPLVAEAWEKSPVLTARKPCRHRRGSIETPRQRLPAKTNCSACAAIPFAPPMPPPVLRVKDSEMESQAPHRVRVLDNPARQFPSAHH